MSKYPLSNYPEEIYDFRYKIDVNTESLYNKVVEYQTLYSSTSGGVQQALDAASEFLNRPENLDLQDTIISANDFNQLGDAIKAIQDYYESDVRKTLQHLLSDVTDWDADTQYYQADVVTYRPTVDTTYAYICTTRETPVGLNPEDGYEYWTKITIKGESGLGLTFRYKWLEGDQYNVGDCVSYKNGLWACVQDCSNIRPDDPDNNYNAVTETGDYWSLIFILTGEDIPITRTDPTSIKDYIDDLFDKTHPVGSYYWSSEPTDPSVLFGGEWERVKNKFVLAAGDEYEQFPMYDEYGEVSQGGKEYINLTKDQLPSHKHSVEVKPTTQLTGRIKHLCSQSLSKINETPKEGAGSVAVVNNSSGWTTSNSIKHTMLTATNSGVIGYGQGTVEAARQGRDTVIIDVNHEHTVSEASVGENEAIRIMPPYETAYCWRRIA